MDAVSPGERDVQGPMYRLSSLLMVICLPWSQIRESRHAELTDNILNKRVFSFKLTLDKDRQDGNPTLRRMNKEGGDFTSRASTWGKRRRQLGLVAKPWGRGPHFCRPGGREAVQWTGAGAD